MKPNSKYSTSLQALFEAVLELYDQRFGECCYPSSSNRNSGLQGHMSLPTLFMGLTLQLLAPYKVKTTVMVCIQMSPQASCDHRWGVLKV